ncbi:MAG: folC [Gammaproteobacteria bacterium]|jgi:dihydrofolate synthase/folylpolyglutamate synthase|nr:folC [Gammaproteobacteria bacterium]
MRFQTLAAWLNWLETLHPRVIELGLTRIQAVFERLELTKPAPYVITVAGTNGKGSCVALLEAVLLAGGHRVGCYTSPHLLTFNERIKINNQPVTDSLLCEAFAYIDLKRAEISLTYFEFITLAALYLFQQHALEVVILEVGMGGRLDAVNIIDTDLAIISGIDFDHMDYLGNTREAIGFEKAGIMRVGKPAIYGGDDIPKSILSYAEQLGIPLYYKGRDYCYEINSTTWQWQAGAQQLTDLPLPKLPTPNAATVLQAHQLLPARLQVSQNLIKNCLAKTRLMGRFHRLSLANDATLLVDVAHNPQSCALLAQRLQAETCTGTTYGLVAMLADKDIKNSLQPLLPVIQQWFLAGLQVTRGGSAKLLEECLTQLGCTHYLSFENVAAAYYQLINQVTSHDRIIVFGSFHTVGAVLALHSNEI